MSDKPTKPTELPVVQQKREATSFLESRSVREAIAKVLPKHLTAERLTRVAITAVMSKPELIEAAAHSVGRASLLNALMRCSQAGLEPDGRLAHLIPFWSSEHRCYMVQVIFDYKGFVTLAKRNGIDAKAVLVRRADKFDYIEDDGTGKTIVRHSFDPFKNRGDIIGVYSRAKEGSKDPDYEFMSIEEVEEVRQRSRAKDKGPWVTDYGEMVKKTPIRRHSKRWELQPEIRDVMNADDDTPPAFGQFQVAPPLFKDNKPVPEASAVAELTNGSSAPNPAEEAAEAAMGLAPAPGGEPIPGASGPTQVALPARSRIVDQLLDRKAADKSGEPTPLVLIRASLKSANITPARLLAFVADIGLTDGSAGSLEELAMGNPGAVQNVLKNWADIRAKLEAADKEAA